VRDYKKKAPLRLPTRINKLKLTLRTPKIAAIQPAKDTLLLEEEGKE
jgi:hypothetical protein